MRYSIPVFSLISIRIRFFRSSKTSFLQHQMPPFKVRDLGICIHQTYGDSPWRTRRSCRCIQDQQATPEGSGQSRWAGGFRPDNLCRRADLDGDDIRGAMASGGRTHSSFRRLTTLIRDGSISPADRVQEEMPMGRRIPLVVMAGHRVPESIWINASTNTSAWVRASLADRDRIGREPSSFLLDSP